MKAKQAQVDDKHRQLQQVKGHKTTLLAKGQEERKALEGQQTEQQNMVASLQKQQKTIQQIIDQQKKVNAKLNAEIDRQIAIEVEKARKRAEEEARRKAEAEAANGLPSWHARRRRLRLRRVRTHGVLPRRRRVSNASRRRRVWRHSVRTRHSANVPNRRRARPRQHVWRLSARLRPMPSAARRLLLPGAQARSIYNGEVSAVFGFSGSMVVMVRHGSYISVYCNLSSVCVSRGQKVSTRQALGTVGRDHILQFQLRHNMAKLNPESWIGR